MTTITTTTTAMTTATPTVDGALLRLLQLASPALPVGAYAYSQGLEQAVAAGWVDDEETAGAWILGLLEHAVPALDIPLLARLHGAWCAEDAAAVLTWSRFLHASRESAELAAEDRALGAALARLLADLGMEAARPWIRHPAAGYPTLFALAAVQWDIGLEAAAGGYLWAWTENQIAAAIKLVPLGQTAGQRLLGRAVAAIPAAVARGLALDDADIGFVAPGMAIASARHEVQYSRLFRS